MKVEVDRGVCGLNGECALAAPDVFSLVDGDLVYAAAPDESQRHSVEAAVAACPTQAITIHDD